MDNKPEMTDAIMNLRIPDKPNPFDGAAKKVALDTKTLCLSAFRKYLPPKKIARLDGLENRIVIASSPEAFKNFERTQIYDNRTKEDPLYLTLGRYIAMNDGRDFIVFQTPNFFWEDLYPQFPYVRPKNELIKEYGEPVAKMYSMAMLVGTVVSHEISHAFQGNLNYPSYFIESAVRYYQYGLYGENLQNLLFQERDFAMVKFYQQLVSKFGEPVHQLNFGHPINPITKIRIFNDVRNQNK